MASLKPVNSWLETSCGCPKYAFSEVIWDVKYEGRKADVLSWGKTLWALLSEAFLLDE